MLKKNIVILILVGIVLLGAGVFYWFKIKSNPVETSNLGVSTEKNYFEINDELAGVSFKIGKKFDRMTTQQLQAKNPVFIYGFSARDDLSINCFVSQTQREQGGQITVGELRDGVFEQLKKIYADAKLDFAELADVGENNNKGTKLKMRYTEENIPMIQWELAGITDKTATFAFCSTPQAVLDLYEEDFNLFLDSLKIK